MYGRAFFIGKAPRRARPKAMSQRRTSAIQNSLSPMFRQPSLRCWSIPMMPGVGAPLDANMIPAGPFLGTGRQTGRGNGAIVVRAPVELAPFSFSPRPRALRAQIARQGFARAPHNLRGLTHDRYVGGECRRHYCSAVFGGLGSRTNRELALALSYEYAAAPSLENCGQLETP